MEILYSITADETTTVARTIAAADRITAEDSSFSQHLLWKTRLLRKRNISLYMDVIML